MAYQPPFPSLRFLQLKAHDLKRRYAAAEPNATRKFTKHWRGALPAPEAFQLADSYRVLARAFRLSDWATLKRGVTLMESVRDCAKPIPTDAELDLLVPMLGGHHPIGAWANRLLEGQGQRGHQAVIRGMRHSRMRVRQACSEYLDHTITTWDDATFSALAGAAEDESPRVRGAVLHALGCQRCKTDPLDDEAVKLFLASAQDPSPRVRGTALAGLGNFAAHPDTREAYMAALTDASSKVRQTAASGLSLCGYDPNSIGALIRLLHNETDARVEKAALTSLTSLVKPLARDGLARIRKRYGTPHTTLRSEGRPDCWFYPAERAAGLPDPAVVTTWLRVISLEARPGLSFHTSQLGLDARL